VPYVNHSGGWYNHPFAAARRKVLTQMQEGDARKTRRWFGVVGGL
jgi:hypothetical protein